MKDNFTHGSQPDKTESMITRLVRRVFHKPSQGNTSLAHSRQVDEAYARLRAHLPEGNETDFIAKGDRDSLKHMVDLRTLDGAREDGDLKMLALMEHFVPESRIFLIRGAAKVLDNHGGDSSTLTSEKIALYATLSDLIMDATVKAIGPEDFANSQKFSEPQPVIFHVLENPEDYPLVEEIVQRGFFEQDEIMNELKERKAQGIHRATNNGFL